MGAKKTFVKFLTGIFTAAIIIVAVALFIRFGMNQGLILDPTKHLTVTYGEIEYTTGAKNVAVLPPSGEVHFEVKNTSKNGYTVEILPNVTTATDFEYKISGMTRKYSDVGDMSKAFDLIQKDDFFTMSGRSLFASELLSDVFARDVETTVDYAPVVIVVTSGDEKITIELVQNLSIELDTDGIVF